MSKKPWVKTIRRETGLVEHVCKHGVGHPACGSVMWMEATLDERSKGTWGVHGCDGCCHATEWRLTDAMDGLRLATGYMAKYREKYRKEQEKA